MLTKGILKSMRVKRKLFKYFKDTQNRDYYHRYKTYRDLLNKLCKKSKKMHYKTFFIKNANDTKKTWNEINKILNRKKTTGKNFQLLLNGILTSDKKRIANNFNHYFVNVAENLSKQIPNTNNKYQDYLKNPNEHSLFLKETTPHEISLIIQNLQSTNTTDIYGITTKFVKLGSPTLTDNISIIFNKSIEEGVFPDLLKVTKINPFHKNGSVLTVSNYRPISLLPIFSKIFERLMYNRILSFINKHNLLTPNQFGFQLNKSTELAVNEITNNINNSFEKKESAFCIFLDFAKAFDTVNHDILINKLEYYGIRGSPLNWFKSYLQDRQQYTNINGTLSSLEYMKCGVPQGSILGPLLFLIYINDIVQSSSILKFILFADDTTIFFSGKPSPSFQNTLNIELDKVNSWLNCNKLSLNVEKSKILSFSLCNKPKLTVSINNKIIKETQVAKYLGILIDNKLLWKDHINSINLKISKGVGLLAKIRHFVPKAVLRSLYFSFINPHIDYNLLNWGSSSMTSINSVNINIKKAIRIMCFKKRDEPSLPLFKELNILPLDKTIKLKQAKFMWRLMNNYLPCSISANFNQHTRPLRSQFSVPSTRLDYASKHITYAGLKLWNNEIPNEIKQKKNLKSFSKSLHKYLLNLD